VVSQFEQVVGIEAKMHRLGDICSGLSGVSGTVVAMPERSRKRPRDPNQLAKAIVDIATGEAQDDAPENVGKDPAAVALGRKGGLKGGKARAAKLSAAERSEAARNAAKARWERQQ
jgi:hypothetical protein